MIETEERLTTYYGVLESNDPLVSKQLLADMLYVTEIGYVTNSSIPEDCLVTGPLFSITSQQNYYFFFSIHKWATIFQAVKMLLYRGKDGVLKSGDGAVGEKVSVATWKCITKVD